MACGIVVPWYYNTVDILLARARLRWNAELGLNAFDNLSEVDAAFVAGRSLQRIINALDDLDNADCLARIFSRIEPSERGESVRRPCEP